MNQENSDGVVNSILDTLDLSKKEAIQYGLNTLSFLGFFASIYLVYWGFTEGIFTSEEALGNFLDYLGPLAPYGFILIQIVQVVVPIIPGSITIPLGALVFGMGYGFLLNFIGIMIGSFINFALARRYGRPFVELIVREKQLEKYTGWLDKNNRFDKLFTFAMFFPLSPDDFLCYFAGLSTISFKKFALILSTSKPFTLFLYSYGMVQLLNVIFQFFG
jgi:uncharacterized membrane protein YdjX (TVP38/TMEM64 family)